MTLHLLPVEICVLIFKYACTDGGQTGKSLSAACRFIRQVSHPYKYQTLAANGRHIPALAEAIQKGYWRTSTQHCLQLLIHWDGACKAHHHS